MNVERMIAVITQYPAWEAGWLWLLGDMEYIGLRKIVRSLPYKSISLAVSQHMADEAQHAFLLYKQAQRLDPSKKGRHAFGNLGQIYFKSLDTFAKKHLPAALCYGAVSAAVEKRVLQVYPLYGNLTQQAPVRRVMAQILEQEKRHSGQFSPDQSETLLGYEQKCWERLARGIQQILQQDVQFGNCRSGVDVVVSAYGRKATKYQQQVKKAAQATLARLAVAILPKSSSASAGRKAILSCWIVDADTMRRLNATYRGKDYSTDVLAFSRLENAPFAHGAHDIGDIALCLEKAETQAKERGLSLAAELTYLTIHGVLHVFGWDHERSAHEAKRMFTLQNAIAAHIPRLP